MNSRIRLRPSSLLLLVILLAISEHSSWAAAITWLGASSSDLGTAGNWTGIHVPPQSGDSWTFGTAAGGTLTNDLTTGAVFSVAGITFSAGAGAFTISASNATNAFTLTGDVTNSSSSLQTINNAFTLSGTRTFTTTAGGGNLSLGGAIDGTGGLIAAGGGTVILTGTNTYSGGTTINSGSTLQFGDGNITGSVTGSITDNGTLIFNRGDNPVFSNAISGTGSLKLISTGTMVLTGTNTYSGGTTINSGSTLQIGNGGTAGSITGNVTDNGNLILNRSDSFSLGGAITGTGSVTVSGSGVATLTGASNYSGGTSINTGATLQIGDGTGSPNGTGSITGTVNNSGTFVFNVANDITFGGVINGTGGVTVNTGVVRLSAAQSYSGPTQLAAGVALVLNLDDALNTSGVNVASAARLDLGGHRATIGGLTGVGRVYSFGGSSGTLIVRNSTGQSSTFSGTLGDTDPNFSFTKDGLGTQVLAGTTTYTGATSILQGTLQSATNASLSATSAISISNGGATLAVNYGGGSDYTGAQVAALLQPSRTSFTDATSVFAFDTTNVGAAGSATYANALTRTFTLTKVGVGTLILSAANSYTGTTSITAGKLALGVNNAIPSTSNVFIPSGGTLDLATFNDSVAGVQLTGGSITGTGVLTSASTFDLQSGSVTAPLGGSVGVAKSGAGTLTLGGTQTYTGPTSISGGILSVSGSISGNTNISTSGSGVLSETSTGSLSGSVSLTMGGAGVSTLGSSNNTYTGATTINGGTLALGAVNALPSGTNVAISSGTLDLVTFPASVAGVQMTGGSITGTGTLASASTFDLQAGSVSANLIGSVGLTKSGAGTVTLSGSNTYSGPTTINAGVLLSAKSTALSSNSTVAVNSAGTLAVNYGGGSDYAEAEVAALFLPSRTTFASATAAFAFDTTNVGAGGTATYATPLTMGGSLTKLGVGTLALTGANTYSTSTLISAGSLQLGNGGTTGKLSPSSAITDNATLAFNRSDTITQGVDFAATISGSGGVTQAGSGTLILNGANTYTGPTVVSSGTLQLSGSLSGNLAVSNGANLILSVDPTGASQATSAPTVGGNLTLNSTVASVVFSAIPVSLLSQSQTVRVLNYSGSFTGSAANFSATQLRNPVFSTATAGQVNLTFDEKALTWSGATSTWDVNGASNWNAGTDKFFTGDGVTFNDTGTSKTVSINSPLMPTGVSFNHSAGNTYTLNGTGSLQGSFTHNGTGDVVINVPIIGTSGLSKTSTGTLTLSAINSYSGVTSNSAGTLSLTGTVSGTALQMSSSGILNEAASGAITGSSLLTLASSGTSVLAGTNNYTGNTTISGGTLSLTGSLSGTAITTSASGILSESATGSITGASRLSFLGSGTSVLAGTNSYTGSTSISAGTLSLSGSLNVTAVIFVGTGGQFSETTTGTITGTPGLSMLASSGNCVLAGVNTYTGFTSISGSTLSLSGSLSGTAITTDASGMLSETATGSITGTSSFSSIGSASSTLAGTNTYTGATSISGGTLNLSGSLNGTAISITNPGSFSETATGTITGASSLTLNGTNSTVIATLAGANTYTGTTRIFGGTLSLTGSLSGTAITIVDPGILSETATGSIAGSSSLTLAAGNTGTNILAGANTYTGSTTINGGTLQLGNGGTSGSLSPSSAINDKATLAFNRSDTITQGTDFGTITGAAGKVTQLGSGTVILTANNTYTGQTTVSGGTFQVDGSIAPSSGVSVAAGAMLSGHGRVSALSGAGLVAPLGGQILTGTNVNPGAGLDFTFKLSLAGAPTYSSASASGNDLLHLTDPTPITLALTSANVITLDFSGVTPVLGQTYLGGFFLDANVSDTLLSSATFAYTGLFGAVQYDGLVTVPSADFATGTVANGKVMEFKIIAVPEPGSIGLALLGTLAFPLRRPRKSRRVC